MRGFSIGATARGLLAAWLLAISGLSAAAAYTPDVGEFDGNNSMSFDPAPQLQLAYGGTIEFWVVPDWAEDPGYDPVIICNAGPEGASYLIAMLRDRDGIVIAVGDQEDVVAFDFTDGRLHHVAISQYEEGTVVFIDGHIAGTSDLRFEVRPSAGVWVGSIDGQNNQFRGAVAGMRVWTVVVEQETLVEYAMKDVFSGQHPNLANLAAISDFNNEEFLLAELDLGEAEQ